MSVKIVAATARAVFFSRENLTVKVDATTSAGEMVSSGVSTGIHEALDLRDPAPDAYLGKGVDKAVANVREKISSAIVGVDAADQSAVDAKTVELDGIEGKFKKNLGANAVLGVSMAVARAGAAAKSVPMYKHPKDLAGNPKTILHVSRLSVISGDSHAGNNLAMENFMILLVGATSF